MAVQITRITAPLRLGEGPHWDEKTKALYFVDIEDSTVHRYVPETNLHTYAKVGENEVSLIIPVENETNKFFITYGCSFATIVWDGISKTISNLCIIHTVDRYPEIRINDGKVSPSGVLFAGTMLRNVTLNPDLPSVGHLYAMKNDRVIKMLEGIKISNGMAWSFDEKYLYYIDSLTHCVESFDYDKKNITLANRRTVFDFKKNNIDGFPDGMTIDINGNLWVACYLGGQVLKIDPKTGILLNSIKLHVPCITSVAFGGQYLEDLYVTSARDTLSEKPLELSSESGCLFKISGTGSKGLPGVSIKF